MALNVSGKKSRLNFGAAVNEGIHQQPSRSMPAADIINIEDTQKVSEQIEQPVSEVPRTETIKSTEPVKESIIEKPAPLKKKSQPAFKKIDFNELVTKYRVKGKVKNVQKTLYISEEVADYIQSYVKEEGEPFGKIVEMLLRKAINE